MSLVTSLSSGLLGNRLSRRLADSLFINFAHRRISELDALDVAKVQAQTLERLVRQAQNTRFGRDHEFGRIRSLSDYRRLVPLRDYEAFWQEYWQPEFPNVSGITWPGAIPYFALSSGTTSGTTKYLPISREMLKSNSRAALTLLCAFAKVQPDARLFQGRLFFLGGSTNLVNLSAVRGTPNAERDPASGAPRSALRAPYSPLRSPAVLGGDLSGIAVCEVPGYLRPFSFPPLDLALLGDWDEKVRVLAEHSARLPITMISGVPSWLLILFHRLKEITGKATISEVWPTLRLVVHGGVKFDPYREVFRQEIGSPSVRLLETYPCSEGFVAFEDPRYDLLRLVPDHDIFFEFVPVEELDKDRPSRHAVQEIELGVQYAVVMTTCAGLWSYLVGDTIAFERRHPPLLRFTGRTKYSLSAFGEHLISEEVERAVAAAAQATGASVLDFHVGPVFPAQPGELGRHRYLVEFGQPPHDLDRFAAELDDQLCRLNEDYHAHRRGGIGMDPPEVCPVTSGGFAAWMRSQGKLGGQHKVPRMDNTGTVTRQMSEWMMERGLLKIEDRQLRIED